MSRGPRLVLLGKQGAGKGTQAERLGRHFDVEHVSTGELFRDAAKAGTAFGLEAQRYMDTGELVPDDIVIGVVEERFGEGGPPERGFVLDGFPRTLRQAVELDRVLASHSLDVVIVLEVSTEIVLDRIAGRRVCENCGRTYHVNMPPEKPWICDACGGRVVQRDDDTEAAILRRFEIYDEETVPLIGFYRKKRKLVTVDGVGDGDEVFERLLAVVDAYCEPCAS
jgi:adenylate kinase